MPTITGHIKGAMAPHRWRSSVGAIRLHAAAMGAL